MKKLILFFAVITVSVLLFTSCKKNDYKVIIKYELSFNGMIKAGQYDSVDGNLTYNHYPIPDEKQGIKVFSITKSWYSDKPMKDLQPREIDSLLVIMDSVDNEKLGEYTRKHGLINPKEVSSGKFNDFKHKIDTVHYKKPDQDTLTMKLFETSESMEKTGYRPATAHEAMIFAGQYPEMQREFNIFALGSVWEKDLGTICIGWNSFRTCYAEYVIILTGNNSVRKIGIAETNRSKQNNDRYGMNRPKYYTRWNDNPDRFLGVLKNDGRIK